jgi:predicted alpha/beta-hydrolase family hydrolase
MMVHATDLRIDVEEHGQVSALFDRPADAWLLYVLAHGAGAGMRHRFLEAIARALHDRGVATLRYQFPYMEIGARRPDPPRVAESTVRGAVKLASELEELPIVAGGKSFGGRMTSGAAATSLPGVRGLVFLGYPLHPPGKPGIDRADHLDNVDLPMLFLQGTRDQFGRLDLITTVCRRLTPRATLHLIEDGDHSFSVPKRGGRSPADVMNALADTIVQWASTSLPGIAR